jgi:hypothetical protein
MAILTKSVVDAADAKEGSEHFIWDDKLAGFGLRVYSTGRKVYVAQVRIGKIIRRVKIGAHGPFTVDQARKQAEATIRAAAEGRDPQREKQAVRHAITVAQLCEEYLTAAHAGLVTVRGRPKRASTIAIDEGR